MGVALARKLEPEASIVDFAHNRQIVIAALEMQRRTRFKTLIRAEDIEPAIFKASTTVGTVLDVAVRGLNAAGVQTGHTIGALMTATGWDQETIHNAVCFCHEGDEITGEHAAQNFRFFR